MRLHLVLRKLSYEILFSRLSRNELDHLFHAKCFAKPLVEAIYLDSNLVDSLE